MDKARLGTDIFGHRGQKGDHIMLDLGLDGVDAGDIEIALGTDNRHDLLGDDTQLGLGLAGQGLNFQPDAEAVFGGPDLGHFGAGIAFNHVKNSSFYLYAALYFHHRTGTVLITDDDARCTDVLVAQESPGRAHHMVRMVVHLGQVGHHQRFQPVMGQFMQQLQRFLVGEMAVTGLDALLQLPRIGAVHQHVHIVVRLQVQKAAAAQLLGHQAGDDPQVGNRSQQRPSRDSMTKPTGSQRHG